MKSALPRFQRYEHEDVTLKWLDTVIARELTKMRFSNNKKEVLSALGKALVVWMTGATEILRFEAVKKPPKDFYDYTFLDTEEDEKMKDENTEELKQHVVSLVNALKRLLDELDIPVKVNRKKYLLVKVNNSWISLGPIAPLVNNYHTTT